MTAADAPEVAARGEIAESLRMPCSDEKDYFRQAFEALASRRQRRIARPFERTVDLEVAFFDATYDGASEGPA